MSTKTTHSKPRHRLVGQFLLQGIEDSLWTMSRPPNAGHRLATRLGAGQATYHRFEPSSRTHLINLGIKMIAAKQEPSHCGAWLSARELVSRRYFDGEISEANLLAHTGCHEFAHLLQSARGERHYGSVHNVAFYRQLDSLYRHGHATRLRHALIEACHQAGVALQTTPVALAPITPPAPTSLFVKGERVYFWHRDTRHTGRITRINRRTCSVAGIGVSQGLRFRVPPALLRSFDR